MKRFLPIALALILPAVFLQLRAQGNGLAREPTVHLLFAGDTHFSWGVRDHQQKSGAVGLVSQLVPLFSRVDLRMVNLETTVGRAADPVPGKYYVFRSEPESLEALRALGVNAVTLANNHILDYGAEGLAETLDHLRSAGIETAGVGRNMEEAVEPVVFSVHGMPVALFAANEVQESGMNGGEKFVLANARALIARIQEVRESGVIAIVNVHWGLEYGTAPSAEQIRLARRLIDNGAAAVIGHHPHVPQGIEVYHNGVICYSLGNFIFGSQTYQQRDNFLAELVFARDKRRLLGIRIHPVSGKFRKDGHAVRPIALPEAEEFWADLRVQNAALSEKPPAIEITGTSGMIKVVLD